MSNTALFGVDPINGRSKWNILDHTGPSSYAKGGESFGQSVYGGPNIFGLSGFQFLASGLSVSGNYRADCLYGGAGIRTSVNLVWSFTNLNGAGVTVVQNAAGTGMTPGTVVPITFTAAPAGGVTAVGTVTVLTATTISINITNPGAGYLTAPTATISATGGTPATLTASLSTPGAQVPAGTNLSGETVRLLTIGG